MNFGAFVDKYKLCVSCGPDAKKCTRRNPSCKNPTVAVSQETYEKVSRIWLIAKRTSRMEESTFLFNYYEYYK